MLQKLRDSSQGLAAKIVIGFIIALMSMFGIESFLGGSGDNGIVAKVNGEDITEPEVANRIQILVASLGGNIASLDEGLLRQIALNQIIEDRVLLRSAKDAHMVISSDAIDRQIINTPQFQAGGVFNSDLALRTMATQGFSVPAYRQALADQMIVEQLATAYSASSFVTESELNRIAGLSSQTRDFRFVSVTLGNRTAGESIPADQIETYYQNNQAQFMVDEEVVINYVVLDKNAIFDEVEVSDDAVQAQYNIESTAFSSASQRRASHILLEVDSSRSEEAALQEAAALKARLDQGEDFAALALEASSDTISAEEGGDIGYSDGSAFPQPVEDALAGLEVGEISDPVVSEFGVHLVKLTEYEVNEFPALDEVVDRIRRELSSAEVDRLFFERRETLANLAFETGDLSAIAEDLGLEIQQSEAFTQLGGSSQITSNSNVITAAFSEDVMIGGNNSDVIELDTSRAMVLNASEHNDASLRPLEEVRGEIAAILRTAIEKERAQMLGEQLLASLRNGESVDEMVTSNELQWISQNGATRNQSGLNNEVLQKAFAMSVPAEGSSEFDGFALGNGTYVVLELTGVTRGSLDQLDASEKGTLASAFVQHDGRTAFNGYLTTARNEADIEQFEPEI